MNFGALHGEIFLSMRYESEFLFQALVGRRIGEAAALVHVHALESAGACFKPTPACPVQV